MSESEIADVAASFQEAIVDVLVEKIVRAVRRTGVKRVAIGGGVSANLRLAEKIGRWAGGEGVHFYEPPERILCLDNAAIVAGFAYRKLKAGLTEQLDLDVSARFAFRVPQSRVRAPGGKCFGDCVCGGCLFQWW